MLAQTRFAHDARAGPSPCLPTPSGTPLNLGTGRARLAALARRASSVPTGPSGRVPGPSCRYAPRRIHRTSREAEPLPHDR